MSIPKYFIEQVKDTIRLSDLIGRFVPLKRAGREFEANCPFHQEKSPSFKVNDEKGFYHCFGCQAHGDAVGFMMAHERMNYVEAIKYLAASVGMDVPEETPEAKQQEDYRHRLLEASEQACRWFEQQLVSNAGMEARAYIKKRGIHKEIEGSFRLGYAPNTRTGLKDALKVQGFDEQTLIDAGLIVRPEQGESYDRFRGRLMFPIMHKRQQVVAFGGRLLSDDAGSKAPKYLNSSETLIFKKRDMLYHLFEAATIARNSKRMVVVEGYMDVIACEQAGIEDTVASLGTAFTEDHLQALWSHVDEPIICLDGDSAGSRAMLRSAELALPHLKPGKALKFAILPKGDDPDSLLKRQGAAALETLINQAVGLHEVLFQASCQQVDSADPAQRAALEKNLNQLSASIQDATTRQHFKNYFREALWALTRSPSKKDAVQGKTKPKGNKSERAMHPPASSSDRLMRSILKFILQKPELLHEVESEKALSHMHCQLEPLEQLRDMLLQMIHEAVPITELEAELDNANLAKVARELVEDRGLLMPKVDADDLTASKEIIAQWINSYDTLRLEDEYQELSMAYGGNDLNDQDIARLMMLQKEIQLRKQQS